MKTLKNRLDRLEHERGKSDFVFVKVNLSAYQCNLSENESPGSEREVAIPDSATTEKPVDTSKRWVNVGQFVRILEDAKLPAPDQDGDERASATGTASREKKNGA